MLEMMTIQASPASEYWDFSSLPLGELDFSAPEKNDATQQFISEVGNRDVTSYRETGGGFSITEPFLPSDSQAPALFMLSISYGGFFGSRFNDVSIGGVDFSKFSEIRVSCFHLTSAGSTEAEIYISNHGTFLSLTSTESSESEHVIDVSGVSSTEMLIFRVMAIGGNSDGYFFIRDVEIN